ncbi:Deoxycytidine monophosphate (dCMP) deaminase [Zalaria obscura]|uniref:Deoxycytidine monophosphate (dCMP) deaminase n=1 Tax=Zalaria obscura TaxID=2024903 RepID=A0ACC3SC01_9PEZI
MFVGVCGGLCAGKNSVATYLVEKHNFTEITLTRPASTPAIEKSASDATIPPPTLYNVIHFNDVSALLDYVTLHWQTNFVTTSIWDEPVLTELQRRPFFILVSVDAPISTRWQRFRDRCAVARKTPPTLEQFVLRNDEHLYDARAGLAALQSRAQIRLLNASTSLPELYKALDAIDLPDPARIRPTWDMYFMTLASLAARRSNCMRRPVGCVVVREKRVISTGYNGTPRSVTNCNEGGCPRCNSNAAGGAGLNTCLCLHAEENALLEAGRDRIGGGAVLYCDTCPCLTCSVKIIQVGISEVVYSKGYHMDSASAAMFKEAGVKLRQFSPPPEGLINLSNLVMPDATE